MDEDVEQKRKASLPKASVVAVEEVHDEENNGYDYEDDEFEVTRLLLHMSIFLPCSRLYVHGQASQYITDLINIRKPSRRTLCKDHSLSCC